MPKITHRGSQAVLRALREARKTAPPVRYCRRQRHISVLANTKMDERGIARCLDCRAEGHAKHARRLRRAS
jgi:hypothetical protein